MIWFLDSSCSHLALVPSEFSAMSTSKPARLDDGVKRQPILIELDDSEFHREISLAFQPAEDFGFQHPALHLTIILYINLSIQRRNYKYMIR